MLLLGCTFCKGFGSDGIVDRTHTLAATVSFKSLIIFVLSSLNDNLIKLLGLYATGPRFLPETDNN